MHKSNDTELLQYEKLHAYQPAGEVKSPLSSQKQAKFLLKRDKKKVWWVP